MLMRIFPVAVLLATLVCAGLADAAALKEPMFAPSAGMDGSRGLSQRSDDKEREDSRLIGAPTSPPSTAGGGSHTDREA